MYCEADLHLFSHRQKSGCLTMQLMCVKMSAKFHEIPSICLEDIKQNITDGWTDYSSEPSCSKLMISLVNNSLKYYDYTVTFC